MNDRSIGNGNKINGDAQNGDNKTNRYDHDWSIASFIRTLTFSTEAGKAIIYINGGAAVSMLTFCGHCIENINFLSIFSLGLFGLGALSGVSALFTAYKAQDHYTHNTHNENKIGDKWNNFSISLGITSGVLFLFGLIIGALAILSFSGKA